MTPVILITLGSYLVFLVLTDQFNDVITGITNQNPTSAAPKLFNYLVGGAVISVPVVLLESQGNTRAAWQYTGLIVVALIVFYYKQFNQTVTRLTGMMEG